MSYNNTEVPQIMEGDLQAALAREQLLTKEIVRLKTLKEHSETARSLKLAHARIKELEKELDRRNSRIAGLQIKLIKLRNRNIIDRILNRYE